MLSSGMNVPVPGQEADGLYWFWSSESSCYLLRFHPVAHKTDSVVRSHRRPACLWDRVLFHCEEGLRYRLIGSDDEIFLWGKNTFGRCTTYILHTYSVGHCDL